MDIEDFAQNKIVVQAEINAIVAKINEIIEAVNEGSGGGGGNPPPPPPPTSTISVVKIDENVYEFTYEG